MGNLEMPSVGPPSPEVVLPQKNVEAAPIPKEFKVPEEKVEKGAETALEPSLEEAQQEIDRLNRVFEGLGNRLEFGLYDGDQLYVQLVDRAKNEVVKVMPPQHLIDLRERIEEAIGVILDERR